MGARVEGLGVRGPFLYAERMRCLRLSNLQLSRLVRGVLNEQREAAHEPRQADENARGDFPEAEAAQTEEEMMRPLGGVCPEKA